MALPDITLLQFLVLTVLLGGEQPGRHIRERLAEEGEKKGGPAFYQMMARMEEAHLVEGWYDKQVIDGQLIKERRYRISAAGLTAWQQVRDFYDSIARERVGLAGGLSPA
jgi:hypothetical protein